MPRQPIFAVFVALLAGPIGRADHFDDHGLKALQEVEKRSDARKLTRLSLGDLAGLPKVVQGAPQSVLLVVRTDERNWSKLLVRAGGIRRKGAAQPQSFLHIERLVTFSANPKRGVLADKRDVYLFDGFGIDLDIGQIVKKGDGDDLSFDAGPAAAKGPASEAMMEEGAQRWGPLKGTVSASAGVDLFAPTAPLVPASKASGRAKSGGAVSPADYAGKYRLDVDGRFTGVLQLRSEGGRLLGTFASDQTGAIYEASGAAGAPAHHAELTINFPRTEMKLDARLFTRSRTRIAGTATMEENSFGFVADRVD
jgi:hypothetical protein